MLGLTVALSFGLDLALNPWAYGLTGHPSAEGDWAGNLTLPNGTTYRMQMQLRHSVVMLNKHADTSTPDITGDAQACAAGLPANSSGLSGRVSWTGAQLELQTGVVFGEWGSPVKVNCAPVENQLVCSFDFERTYSEAAQKVLKKMGRDTRRSGLQSTMQRLTTHSSEAPRCTP